MRIAVKNLPLKLSLPELCPTTPFNMLAPSRLIHFLVFSSCFSKLNLSDANHTNPQMLTSFCIPFFEKFDIDYSERYVEGVL